MGEEEESGTPAGSKLHQLQEEGSEMCGLVLVLLIYERQKGSFFGWTHRNPRYLTLCLALHCDMILAFCLSMLVGLLLGALVYLLLTWASRRRATARITRRSKKKSRTSQAQTPMTNQLGLYRSTFLSVYRQPSLEPVGPLGLKPGAETSTFRPLAKRSRAELEMGDDTQVTMPEDTAASTSSDSASLVPNKRHSFWLGGNGLKGFLPSQTPPPAYDSVIHAFEETCT
eukprot:superscaffoldBa00002049_g12992